MKIAIILLNKAECELDRKIFAGDNDGEDVQDLVGQAIEDWSMTLGDMIIVKEVK